MSVLTTSSPLRFQINRLRIGYMADADLWSDDDLLAILNEAQIAIVNPLRYLRTLTQIPLSTGQMEYGLSPNTIRVYRVYVDGVRLEPVPDTLVGQAAWGYYQVGSTIGFSRIPDDSVSAWVYAAEQPTPMLIDDTPVIPPECYYLLRHYAAWKILLLQGGAQRIGQAQTQKALFDAGVKRLRQEMTPLQEARAQRVTQVWERAC